jgi:hypothetical protein
MIHMLPRSPCVPGNGVQSPVPHGGSRPHLLGSELWDMRRLWSPPRAEKQGSKSVGRVIVPEPSHLGSKDPERWGTWWHVDAHPTPGLTWGLYVGVNGLQGTNKPPVKDSLVYHG